MITFYPLLHRKQMRKDRNNTMRAISQPLFPGYMFLCFDSSGNLFHKVECCEGVICFVRFGNGPAIIRDSVMENIIAACFKLGVEMLMLWKVMLKLWKVILSILMMKEYCQ
ncbi:hypothetical protein B6C32_23700 [Salmonella enterica subsp. enterica serovar Typhimurium]|nr:hypothetical protein [Salmonella enterica subsp. enterica serovar Typhimurium]